jgi:hypothetical protein
MARRKTLMDALRAAVTGGRGLQALYRRELPPAELAERVARLRAQRRRLRRSAAPRGVRS